MLQKLYVCVLKFEKISDRDTEKITKIYNGKYNFKKNCLKADECLTVYLADFGTREIISFYVEMYGSLIQNRILRLDNPYLLESPILGNFKALDIYVILFSDKAIKPWSDFKLVGIVAGKKYDTKQCGYIRSSLKNLRRIEAFKDTQDYISHIGELRERTDEVIRDTTIYDENFVSAKKPEKNMSVVFQTYKSLQAAAEYTLQYKTAVLNFANPVEPGGGVLRGANAQEEYLCRASNLYGCLSSDAAYRYYDMHRKMMRSYESNGSFIGTDSLIYSAGVTVFKKDENIYHEYQEVMPCDSWYRIDVITCAAPIFDRPVSAGLKDELRNIFKSRIRSIFEAVIENNVEALILGAWGCGAFNNPPELVALAFKDVLLEERYSHAFDKVVFSVYSPSPDKNEYIFRRYFDDFPNLIGHI